MLFPFETCVAYSPAPAPAMSSALLSEKISGVYMKTSVLVGSMFLDVCRVLTTIKNLEPTSTLVFMYTPEIFSDNKAEDMASA